MAVPQLLQNVRNEHPGTPDLPQAWLDVLNNVRMMALGCRAAAYTDLFKACALLSTKQNTARDAHAQALLRCLRQAVGRSSVFYRPGSVTLSFDEAWLMRAIMAAHSGDSDSFAFLIRSRVLAHHQRSTAFLITGMARQITSLE